MKLRRMGNSLGTTFAKDLLARAGFSEDDELVVTASPGDLHIKRANGAQLLELSVAEMKALAAGNLDSRAGQTASAKARKALEAK